MPEEQTLRSEWLFATVSLAVVVLTALLLAAGDSEDGRFVESAASFVAIAFAITIVSALLSLFRGAVLKIRDELEIGFLHLLLAFGWIGPVYLARFFAIPMPANDGLFVLGSAASILTLTVILLLRPAQWDATQNWIQRSLLSIAPAIVALLIGGIAGFDPARSAVASSSLGFVAVLGLGLMGIGWLRARPSLGFFGLQLSGLAVAGLIRSVFADNTVLAMASASMLLAGSSAVGLYGIVVSIRGDLAGKDKKIFRSFIENQRLAVEVAATRQENDEQMHSLRSGLMGVEALARSLGDQNVATLLADEAERLRNLTDAKKYELSIFDLMEDLNGLVEIHLRASSPCTVEGPRSLMVKAARGETLDAVQSLMANSVRHAPGSPVRVRVDVVGVPFAAISVSVEDRGPGVAAKISPRIFEHGFTTHRDGTGIGLGAARKIAENQGGRLTHENRIGGGARFVLLIPLDPIGINKVEAPAGGPMFAGASE